MITKRAYTPEDCLKFYQMPQIFYNKESKYFKLMKNGIARELYMLLKDRNELSIKNGWIDKEGYIYFYFKQEELAEMLRVSPPTLRKAFNELKDAELIHVVRQGMNLPNILYLLQPENDVETQEELGYKNSFYPDGKILSVQGKNSFYPDGKILSSNNTKFNYTNNINTKRANNNSKAPVPKEFYYDWMKEDGE
jgi:DNA-binding transcriptional ArsR family regulator|nr:MAG TPA: replication initiator protein [Caudoviricetes sp.]DAR74128.1 MAG TPA: replication initiator protein [Caudoviricetes sp.]